MALPSQHGIHGSVRQRYRLGTARQGADSRQRAAQLGQHRRVGLDRDDVGTQRDQRGGQLAGAGTEVEHARAGRGLKRPAHRSLRVVRTVLGVCGRRCAERRGVKLPFILIHAVTLSALQAVSYPASPLRQRPPESATRLALTSEVSPAGVEARCQRPHRGFERLSSNDGPPPLKPAHTTWHPSACALAVTNTRQDIGRATLTGALTCHDGTVRTSLAAPDGLVPASDRAKHRRPVRAGDRAEKGEASAPRPDVIRSNGASEACRKNSPAVLSGSQASHHHRCRRPSHVVTPGFAMSRPRPGCLAWADPTAGKELQKEHA
ncbi:hypothetical protein GCM10020000_03440 [Streptomyces olivoverticillatus]